MPALEGCSGPSSAVSRRTCYHSAGGHRNNRTCFSRQTTTASRLEKLGYAFPPPHSVSADATLNYFDWLMKPRGREQTTISKGIMRIPVPFNSWINARGSSGWENLTNESVNVHNATRISRAGSRHLDSPRHPPRLVVEWQGISLISPVPV